MADVPIVVPDLGYQVAHVRVVEWRKPIGATVAHDEIVVGISVEKIDIDLTAPIAGTLIEIRAEAGESVAVGATIGIISG